MKFHNIIVSFLICVSFLSVPMEGTAQRARKKKQVEKAADNVTKKDTVIVYVVNGKREPADTPAQYALPTKVDTVIILPVKKRGGSVPKEVKAEKPVVIAPPENPECNCVIMKVNTPDTLLYNAYINYVFSFQNNCKETVWVPASYFSYNINYPDGKPVKVIRKLQYVKHYKYPDFVPIKPGTSFDFRFGDDIFFEYDLRQGWKYKFTFIYHNKSIKSKTGKTYLCTEVRDRFISVK